MVENTVLDEERRFAFSRQGKSGSLVVVDGPDMGRVYAVGTAPMLVGTGDDADIQLSDPRVSRSHLRITPAKGASLELRDLESTNGSFLHDTRFTQLTIVYGTGFRVGQTVLKYVPAREELAAGEDGGPRYGSLMGQSPEMRQLFRILDEVAAEEATVLIAGETGTGKELVAQEIHEHSPRAGGPFVVFDCAAIPRELIESALFGHVRGAFTGATGDRIGAFEQANGGTIFLDEIGELQSELQPTLLRVLESRTVSPVGSNDYKKIDVRVVAASHRQLLEHVEQGTFREDLYYRLAVVCLEIPPLRQRKGDVELLAQYFLQRFSRGRPIEIDDKTMTRFRRHTWPGNVRELRNAVERLCVFSGREVPLATARSSDAPPGAIAGIPSDLPFRDAKQQVVEAFEREFITRLLESHNNNISAAAREAKIDRKHLRDLARKYEVI